MGFLAFNYEADRTRLRDQLERLAPLYERASEERSQAQAEAIMLRYALAMLLDWAENIEGEGKLRRTEALELAREALANTRQEP